MDAQAVIGIVSAVTVSIILIMGICLLGGWFIPEAVPPTYRFSIGSIMTLYAFYRGIMIWLKYRRESRNENV